MAVIHVPSAMRELTGGVARIDVAGETVGAVIQAMEAEYPGFEERLMIDGKLRPGMQIFVDGVSNRSGLRARVKEDTRVHFIPAMAGGYLKRGAAALGERTADA